MEVVKEPWVEPTVAAHLDIPPSPPGGWPLVSPPFLLLAYLAFYCTVYGTTGISRVLFFFSNSLDIASSERGVKQTLGACLGGKTRGAKHGAMLEGCLRSGNYISSGQCMSMRGGGCMEQGLARRRGSEASDGWPCLEVPFLRFIISGSGLNPTETGGVYYEAIYEVFNGAEGETSATPSHSCSLLPAFCVRL